MDSQDDVRIARMKRIDLEPELSLTLTKLAYVSAPEIFDVVRNPTLHIDFDPKRMIVSVDPTSADPINAVGDTFTMNMVSEKMGGNYRMVNHVTRFEHNAAIAWQPATEGYPPLGHRWTWSLQPRDNESTYVSLTYDWLEVTHKGFLAKNTFPIFPLESFHESVEALVEFIEADWGDESEDAPTCNVAAG